MAAEAPRLRIREVELFERPVRLRMPFRFGVVTLTECPQAFARVRIELPDGRSAQGAAAELMAPKWFDKNLALSNEDNFEQLRGALRHARQAYLGDASAATAFGHFARCYDACLAEGARAGFNPLLSSYGPALLDRAVLDALCRAMGVSFYQAVQNNLPGIGPGRPEFAGLDMAAFLSTLRPSSSIAVRHTVGLTDAITAADLRQPVNDGLPETLEDVVRVYGHQWFKLKVGGQVEADLARLEAIAAVLDRSAHPYFVSLDGNEQYDSAQAVQALVEGIRARASLARLWQAVAFIEQPITRHHALDVAIDARALQRPVIIDESDGEMDSFVRARERGYSGVSSKTCKGLYKSLLNAARCAAWNREAGAAGRYFMSAEDLTTQAGLAVQQDLALVNLLGIGHVERNGHHYVRGLAAVPESEQSAFLAAHPDLYTREGGVVRLDVRGGRVRIGSLVCTGFASGAMPAFEDMAAF